MGPGIKLTKEQFFRGYAERSGLTVDELKKLGGVAEKCDCGIHGCHGWQMITEHRRIVMTEEKAEVAETEEDGKEEVKEDAGPPYPLNVASMQELDCRFTYHAPKGDQLPRYTKLRDAARDLAIMIQINTPSSREQSLALTKLEESVMWANASIARRE